MDMQIQSILEGNEQVVWEGKQDLKASLLKGFTGLIVLFIIGAVFFFISSSGGTCTINGQVRPAEDCAGMMGYVMYGLFILAFLSPVFTYLRYKVTDYVITNKRIILKSGIIGADMRSVYYDQIKSLFVDVGIIGKMFGTGCILIDTGKITHTDQGTKTVYDRINNIKSPYDTYKLLQGRLSNRKEGLYSGRADYESNKQQYGDFVRQTEQMKK